MKSKQKGFIKIDMVLPDVSKQYNLGPALALYQVTKSWQQAIAEFFKQAADLTKVIDFKNGKLTVACLSKELAQEIVAVAQRIVYAINSLLGKNLVYVLNVES